MVNFCISCDPTWKIVHIFLINSTHFIHIIQKKRNMGLNGQLFPSCFAGVSCHVFPKLLQVFILPNTFDLWLRCSKKSK